MAGCGRQLNTLQLSSKSEHAFVSKKLLIPRPAQPSLAPDVAHLAGGSMWCRWLVTNILRRSSSALHHTLHHTSLHHTRGGDGISQ